MPAILTDAADQGEDAEQHGLSLMWTMCQPGCATQRTPSMMRAGMTLAAMQVEREQSDTRTRPCQAKAGGALVDHVCFALSWTSTVPSSVIPVRKVQLFHKQLIVVKTVRHIL